jgi:hypothetical protein
MFWLDCDKTAIVSSFGQYCGQVAPIGLFLQLMSASKKIAEAPQELHREKYNHYRRILASTVPNYIQLRPVIVPWSSLYRARLGA